MIHVVGATDLRVTEFGKVIDKANYWIYVEIVIGKNLITFHKYRKKFGRSCSRDNKGVRRKVINRTYDTDDTHLPLCQCIGVERPHLVLKHIWS